MGGRITETSAGAKSARSAAMYMRELTIFIFILLLSCNTPLVKQDHAKNSGEIISQKSKQKFDTLPNGQRLLDNKDSAMNIYYREVVGSDTLIGGYIICYGIDDSFKYFYLRQGDKLFLLNKSPNYMSAWSLGTLEKDFKSFFITSIDNGNGVPETYQVFDKETGKNMLGDKIEAWNYKYLGDTLFLLYDNNTVNLIGSNIYRKTADSIFLYNVVTKKRQGFALPAGIGKDSYLDLKKLTKNSFTISYTRIRSGNEENEERFLTHSR